MVPGGVRPYVKKRKTKNSNPSEKNGKKTLGVEGKAPHGTAQSTSDMDRGREKGKKKKEVRSFWTEKKKLLTKRDRHVRLTESKKKGERVEKNVIGEWEGTKTTREKTIEAWCPLFVTAKKTKKPNREQ